MRFVAIREVASANDPVAWNTIANVTVQILLAPRTAGVLVSLTTKLINYRAYITYWPCLIPDCSNDDSNRHKTDTNSSNISTTGTSTSAKLNLSYTFGSTLKIIEKYADLDSTALLTNKPRYFLNPEVIEATIRCVAVQAEECQENDLDSKTSEKLILEEFGRCMVEIIKFSQSDTDE